MRELHNEFTITLIVEGVDSKLLVSTSKIPAKEDSEASGILYREDLPEQFNEVVSKIPLFKTAIDEDGSEESITHTLDEFINIYDLDLATIIEEGEELLQVNVLEDVENVLSESTNPNDIYQEDNDFDDFDPREALD